MSANGIFNATSIPLLEQALYFTQARHSVLASNIANLDTPGYKVRDYSPQAFQHRLKEAIERRDRRREPISPGNPQRLHGDPFRNVRDGLKSILFHDDSDVGIEQQVTEVAKNQASHNLIVAVMANQFQLLNAAISERA